VKEPEDATDYSYNPEYDIDTDKNDENFD